VWAFAYLFLGAAVGHLLGVGVEKFLGLPTPGEGPWPGVLGGLGGGLALLYKGLSLAGQEEGRHRNLALAPPSHWWPLLLLPAAGHISERVLALVRASFPALDMGAVSALESDLQAWGGHSLFFLFAVVFVAPMGEEVLFRGVLFRGLERSFGPGMAMVGSAAGFAIWHLDPAHVLAVFVIGLWLSWMRAVTGSIWPSLVGHMLNNAVWVIGTMVWPLGLPAGAFWDLACLSALGGAFWGLRGACDWRGAA
jgi:membrane protease YdiL (CAAX protease family)